MYSHQVDDDDPVFPGSPGSDEGSALVVGKYITPDLLVSYEQALKEKSTSYVVMEYMLTRYIMLETLYSNQSKTGIGLSIEKNY